MRTDANEIFETAYQKPGLLFGSTASQILGSLIGLCRSGGRILEVGCGDGRDTLHFLRAGFNVVALDVCESAIRKLTAREDLTADERSRLSLKCADVRNWEWPSAAFDVIYGMTLLDHLTLAEASGVVVNMFRALNGGGILCLEVHTTDDPGAQVDEPLKSEFSRCIAHYFAHNQLLTILPSEMRVMSYAVRKEWDFDHGQPHQHGFATVIALKPV